MQKSKIKNTTQNSKRFNKNRNIIIEKVILVDKKDKEIGVREKLEVHKKGLLHRAVSVVIVNAKGEILLQKRNKKKYHSGGLWTNTCCGHPRPGENNWEAAERRLFEEMGIRCRLKEKFTFHYQKILEKGIIENEIDHVFTGLGDNLEIKPEKEEVEDWKWVNKEKIKEDILKNPDKYTYWFKMLMKKIEKVTSE